MKNETNKMKKYIINLDMLDELPGEVEAVSLADAENIVLKHIAIFEDEEGTHRKNPFDIITHVDGNRIK
jgi:hypothetical protein